jgi:hypothetical protein
MVRSTFSVAQNVLNATSERRKTSTRERGYQKSSFFLFSDIRLDGPNALTSAAKNNNLQASVWSTFLYENGKSVFGDQE